MFLRILNNNFFDLSLNRLNCCEKKKKIKYKNEIAEAQTNEILIIPVIKKQRIKKVQIHTQGNARTANS